MHTSPSGKVNPIGVALILGVIAAIYYVVVFSPVYLDNFDVSEAVAAAYNQVDQISDDRILPALKGKLDRIGTHREPNEDGVLEETMGLGLDEDALTIDRNPDGTVLVRVAYTREVRLKPTQRWVKVRFAPQRSGRPAGSK